MRNTGQHRPNRFVLRPPQGQVITPQSCFLFCYSETAVVIGVERVQTRYQPQCTLNNAHRFSSCMLVDAMHINRHTNCFT